MTTDCPDISIVAPAFNESDTIKTFHARLTAVLDALDLTSEIVFINDGSTDDTLDQILALKAVDPRIVLIDLSRNFGKEIALTAGLDHATGRATIPIDTDLQDPPELIPDLIAKWQQGFQVVNARRRSRQGESYIKKATAAQFYRIMQRFGQRYQLPKNVGDFRLIDRKALDAVNTVREHHRFMKGIFALVGFRHAYVDYDRDPRFGGTTSFNYWKLWNFSLEGITSFTTFPLRLFSYMGFLVALVSFVYGIIFLARVLAFGDPVSGFPTLFLTMTFLGGVQLIGLGVIGEYLGRVFNETKNRPLYFVNDIYAQSTETPKALSVSTPIRVAVSDKTYAGD